MISNLQIKLGPTSKTQVLEVECTPITLFVGPNNSGTSLVLSEINFSCQNPDADRSTKIVKSLKFRPIINFEQEIVNNTIKDDPLNNQIIFGKNHRNFNVQKQHLL